MRDFNTWGGTTINFRRSRSLTIRFDNVGTK